MAVGLGLFLRLSVTATMLLCVSLDGVHGVSGWEEMVTANVLDRHGHNVIPRPGDQDFMVFGGVYNGSYSNSMRRYSPSNEAWFSVKMLLGSPLPFARKEAAGCLIPSKEQYCIYGGFDGVADTDDFQCWNRTTPAHWLLTLQFDNSPGPLSGATCVGVESTLILFGGQSGNSVSNSVHTLDFVSPWVQRSTSGYVPTPRWGHTAIATSRNTMVVYGGEGIVGGVRTTYADVFELDLETWIWTEHPLAPVARSFHSSILVHEKFMMVFGGYDSATASMQNTGIYDIELQLWESFAGGPTARHSHTAALVSNSTVYITGGYGGPTTMGKFYLEPSFNVSTSDATATTSSTTETTTYTTSETGNPTVTSSVTPSSEITTASGVEETEGGTPIGMIIGTASAFIVVCAVAIVIAALLLMNKKKKSKDEEKQVDIPMKETEDSKYSTIPANSFAAAPTERPSVSLDRSDWEIDFNEIAMEKEVGSGAFGVVFKAKWRKQAVAVKQLKTEELTENSLVDFRSETAVMTKMRPHPNVLLLMGICSVRPPYCIVTEFMEGGSLWELLIGPLQLSQKTLFSILFEVAGGLNHLHLEGVVHRDLAARNILIREGKNGWHPKISDFGLSRIYYEGISQSNQTTSDTGPLKIMAPECLINREYSTKSDVWAFAVLINEVFTRAEPYPALSAVQVAAKVCRGELAPETPKNAPPVISIIMKKSIQFEASSRPAMDDILEWMEGSDVI